MMRAVVTIKENYEKGIYKVEIIKRRGDRCKPERCILSTDCLLVLGKLKNKDCFVVCGD